ncbi:MAG: glycosyltransferase family 2 protein [Flavobacterium sp.]|jgi:dTDP-glucose pyrophosphorylase|uniref:glycosyltransferase family 2 protein n=1 Tax=Flavobacterium sp. TaxID=239 RepID=UPI0022C54E80|nr:glycosyltransferase family 2 protein [Flavobacterium sp.]MCZ8168803.1 glycosyltransferase family 2 protein [Flavobacterium sp.]
MINIVIPMAGQGSRFAQAGYEKPKPFIDVNGKPMIARVMENLYYPNANYILIARKEHLEQERELVAELEKNYKAKFIELDQLTEGTACTVLFARKYINNDYPLLIANSDQLVDMSIEAYIDDCLDQKADGSILTFVDAERNPKWSFAKIDDKGNVTEVKEKKAISEFATVGIYFFTKGHYFVDGAIDMIANNDRVNNEFYTCPVYNYCIVEGQKIKIYNIDFEAMHGLGTPEDLTLYLEKHA